MFSLKIRNHLTDRALKPLREQLSGFIADGCNVVDVGCANGRLLLDNADRLNKGMGIDLDKKMIEYAVEQAGKMDPKNLRFEIRDALEAVDHLPFKPDLTVCSLSLHEMVSATAVKTISKYAALSDQLIIADLVEPDSWIKRQFLHLDEWMAGHHDRFVAYLQNGGMPGLLEQSGITVQHTQDAAISAVKIWICCA